MDEEHMSAQQPVGQFFGLDKPPADRFSDTGTQQAEQFSVRPQHFPMNPPMKMTHS